MTKLERDLLGRLLRSRQFANAESLRKALVCLCRNKERPLEEHEIAVNALGRPPDSDWRRRR